MALFSYWKSNPTIFFSNVIIIQIPYNDIHFFLYPSPQHWTLTVKSTWSLDFDHRRQFVGTHRCYSVINMLRLRVWQIIIRPTLSLLLLPAMSQSRHFYFSFIWLLSSAVIYWCLFNVSNLCNALVTVFLFEYGKKLIYYQFSV